MSDLNGDVKERAKRQAPSWNQTHKVIKRAFPQPQLELERASNFWALSLDGKQISGLGLTRISEKVATCSLSLTNQIEPVSDLHHYNH